MPLGFLVPAFLAAFAALAVPIVLHLRQREREKPLRFPSLMFLQRIPIQTAQRRRITDWPLLLLRALAIALLVLAFARPVWRRALDAERAGGARTVVVALDRSLSMGHTAVWPAALDSARAVINALSGEDRVAIVAFDDDATIVQPLTVDRGAALAALGTTRPGARGTRFAAGLRAARQLLGASQVTGAEIAVVTDLQRSGVSGLAGLTLPAGYAVRAVAVPPATGGNAAIVSADVQRLPGDGRGRVAVGAQIQATGLPATRPVELTLTVNGREGARRQATLPKDGTAAVAFEPVPLPPGEVQVAITMTTDALAADDSFRVVIPAEASAKVLLVTPADVRPDETLFLERALAIGKDPVLQIERRSPAALDAATLRSSALVLFVDIAPPAGSGGAALTRWVEEGGGIVIAAGPRLAPRRETSPMIPATFRGMVDRLADRGGLFGDVSLEHPIFAPFRGAVSSALGTARFARYARLAPDSGGTVLARFDDGAPALIERVQGSGRVVVAAVPLDGRGGDFPLQPAFLPFLRQLVLHTAGHEPRPLWHQSGDGWRPARTLRNLVIRSPSGELSRPDSGGRHGAVTLQEAGFYQAWSGQAAGAPLAAAATNAPARESDLTAALPGELLVGVGQDDGAAESAPLRSAIETEQRQRLWRVLLLVVAALLVAETLLASTGWRGMATRGTAPPEGSVS